jgi:hypothetical protein
MPRNPWRARRGGVILVSFGRRAVYDTIVPWTRASVVYALASAALFTTSKPAANVQVGSIHPALLTGLLYCPIAASTTSAGGRCWIDN